MNFEFIDLSLDDRQFKGETHNKNLEDTMKQAIVNFCKSMDTGLFLLDMPTGFGKTYSVIINIMLDHNMQITSSDNGRIIEIPYLYRLDRKEIGTEIIAKINREGYLQ